MICNARKALLTVVLIVFCAGTSGCAAATPLPTATAFPSQSATLAASPAPAATENPDAKLAAQMDAALAALAEKGSLSGSVLVARTAA